VHTVAVLCVAVGVTWFIAGSSVTPSASLLHTLSLPAALIFIAVGSVCRDMPVGSAVLTLGESILCGLAAQQAHETGGRGGGCWRYKSI